MRLLFPTLLLSPPNFSTELQIGEILFSLFYFDLGRWNRQARGPAPTGSPASHEEGVRGWCGFLIIPAVLNDPIGSQPPPNPLLG